MAPVQWRAPKTGTAGGTLARRIATEPKGEERIIISQHDDRYLTAKPWQIWNARGA